MNLFNSNYRVVNSALSAVEARFAILPMNVASPVLMQIPIPSPAVQLVPKKQTFLVSKIFSLGSLLGSRSMSSDSPVKEALLTLSSLALNKTKSQGILAPVLTITTSPGTIYFASIFYCLPSRIT